MAQAHTALQDNLQGVHGHTFLHKQRGEEWEEWGGVGGGKENGEAVIAWTG